MLTRSGCPLSCASATGARCRRRTCGRWTRPGNVSGSAFRTDHAADHLSNRFLGYLHASQTKADEWNRKNPDPRPKRRTRLGWKIKAATRRRLPPPYAKYGPDKSYRERVRTQAKAWKANSRKHGNLALALFKTFPSYWYAGMFKVLADMTQLMSPLVIKALIRFSQQGQ